MKTNLENARTQWQNDPKVTIDFNDPAKSLKDTPTQKTFWNGADAYWQSYQPNNDQKNLADQLSRVTSREAQDLKKREDELKEAQRWADAESNRQNRESASAEGGENYNPGVRDKDPQTIQRDLDNAKAARDALLDPKGETQKQAKNNIIDFLNNKIDKEAAAANQAAGSARGQSGPTGARPSAAP